jgi:hypothetical protein
MVVQSHNRYLQALLGIPLEPWVAADRAAHKSRSVQHRQQLVPLGRFGAPTPTADASLPIEERGRHRLRPEMGAPLPAASGCATSEERSRLSEARRLLGRVQFPRRGAVAVVLGDSLQCLQKLANSFQCLQERYT